MRNAIAIALCLGGLAGCASTGTKEPSPLPPPPPLGQGAQAEPASLLRRLAEAADGFRDGRDKYVVADHEFPHHVLLVANTLREARDSLSRSHLPKGSDYRLYGPFRTPVDTGLVAKSEDEVVEVIVVTASGKRKSYDGRKYDAMFWGVPAFDKFVAPYLTAVYGVKYAAQQRQLYLEGRSPLVHSIELSHYRSSF